MTAQLAEQAYKRALGPTTVEDWLAAEEPADGSRLELILGYYAMTPPPSGSHQDVTAELTGLVRAAVKAAGRTDLHGLPGVGVPISTPLRTALIPDLVVVDVDVCRLVFEPKNVLLAVEVWSPGNSQKERETKMAAYAEARIPYVWLLETPPGKPVVFRGYELDDADYVQVVEATDGETVTAPGPLPVEIDTSRLR
ncbi:Uma2 family endonuclease [Amycolatopsis sp. K13G38]|uniref:Uma2 family endonuclease n=1 Tax=Amycolatopsis acididurans TaxID=2724524 RepID=A0ABX1JFD5_9PSEU|nr:Uma2 family endonuclease [Amycolatopsis acididurans]NKQ57115.1 Uma2 family endonuclease [Amycolatopsis acididurans]